MWKKHKNKNKSWNKKSKYGYGTDRAEFLKKLEEKRKRREQTVLEVEQAFGFETFSHGASKTGWLVNFKTTTIRSEQENVPDCAGLDLYFIDEYCDHFKATIRYNPYFFVSVKDSIRTDIAEFLSHHFRDQISKVEIIEKLDLDAPNHLSSPKSKYVKVMFHNIKGLLEVRETLRQAVKKNKLSSSKAGVGADFPDTRKLDNILQETRSWPHEETNSAKEEEEEEELERFMEDEDETSSDEEEENRRNPNQRFRKMKKKRSNRFRSPSRRKSGGGSSHHQQNKKFSMLQNLEGVEQLYEFDVKYHVRVSIDLNIRVGKWYDVKPLPATNQQTGGNTELTELPHEERASPRVCAFDIETTKAPLLFPDAEHDQVIMISYMIDGDGYLIVNREIVSDDIEDFEYTPKPEYPGHFTIFNEVNEKACLIKWAEHLRQTRPVVYVTYNGDFFDFPFLEVRYRKYGLSLRDSINVYEEMYGSQGKIFRSSYGVHMDCFYWVRRDSYLPAGSHGLKAVTKNKLGYNPVEVDYEEIVPMATSDPHKLAQYSVSDAVATYYLYMKYVHPFIFSLCMLIPMPPDDVLRKGTGTLCEALLVARAFSKNIICPNPKRENFEKVYKGKHILNTETYIGGHVEALRSGIFRNDLKEKFDGDPTAYQQLIDDLDDALQFHLSIECGLGENWRDEITNYDEVKREIVHKFEQLRDTPKRIELPKIYHLDVGAMYPNIILTNRLQPCSIVTPEVCLSCDFNLSHSNCKRKMDWVYRANYYAPHISEFYTIKNQLSIENFPPNEGEVLRRRWEELEEKEQREYLVARLKKYSQKVYNKIYVNEETKKKSIVCMRENAFYVDTIKNFRDRRYDYKRKLKQWAGKYYGGKDELARDGQLSSMTLDELEEAKNKIVLYDSIQIAHKCILNSFYGYVMRKGARWYSMEMAGIVTKTGAQIIKDARELTDRIGIALELDTDGIWCLLPSSFPENFNFTGRVRKYKFSYPCVMLNYYTYKNYSNTQYQDLNPQSGHYESKLVNEIFFEVDGPYRAMILPASKEEGKGIKKRYAVYNLDGTLAELKGFEIKRRGELKLIKILQGQIFEKCLEGKSLKEAYAAISREANQYLDILFTEGQGMETEMLLSYLTESSNMSKSYEEYGGAKSMRLTTAKRLAELHGDRSIIQKGLTCEYVVSKEPTSHPVSMRAIPIQVFKKPSNERLKFLRKWTGIRTLDKVSASLHQILDWQYYIERVGSMVQKIITIPAVLQGEESPIPRVTNPSWVQKMEKQRKERQKQSSILDLWKKQAKKKKKREKKMKRKNLNKMIDEDEDEEEEEIERDLESKHQKQTNKTLIDIEDLEKDDVNMSTTTTTQSQEKTQPKLSLEEEHRRKEEKRRSKKRKRKKQNEKKDPLQEVIDNFDDYKSKSRPVRKMMRKSDPWDNDAFFRHDNFTDFLQFQKLKWRKQEEKKKSEHEYDDDDVDGVNPFSSLTPQRKKQKMMNSNNNNNNGMSMFRSPSSASKKKNRNRRFSSGLLSYVRQQERHLRFSTWYILEIRETKEKGLYKLFFLTKSSNSKKGISFHSILLNIERKVYLHYRNDQSKDWGKQVFFHLPHGKPLQYLYATNMEESEYEVRDFRRFMASDGSLEAVYEAHVPLHHRFLINVGSMCRLTKSARAKIGTVNTELKLEDLISVERDDTLSSAHQQNVAIYRNPVLNADRIFVYMNVSSNQKIGICVISTLSSSDDQNQEDEEQVRTKLIDEDEDEDETPTTTESNQEVKRMTVITLQPARSGRAIPNWSTEFSTYEVETPKVTNINELYVKMQKTIDSYRVQIGSGQVVLVQLVSSFVHKNEMMEHVHILEDFPILWFGYATKIEEKAIQNLNWMELTKQRFVSLMSSVTSLFDERFSLSSFIRIPISNLLPSIDQSDYDDNIIHSSTQQQHNHFDDTKIYGPLKSKNLSFYYSIQFGRELRQNNHLLWISGPTTTDPLRNPRIHGGKFNITHYELNTPGFVHLNRGGVYCPDFVVKVDLANFFVNALMNAKLIENPMNEDDEIFRFVTKQQKRNKKKKKQMFASPSKMMNMNDETSTSSTPEKRLMMDEEESDFFSSGMIVDEKYLTHRTFDCLSSFIGRQVYRLDHLGAEDLKDNEDLDTHLDMFLNALPFWINDSRDVTNILYDPVLRNRVSQICKNCFLLLLANIEKLGTEVIYGDYEQLILRCKNKKKLCDAVGHIKLVINSISKKKMFRDIEFEIIKFWEEILWLDLYNYIGVSNSSYDSKKHLTRSQKEEKKSKSVVVDDKDEDEEDYGEVNKEEEKKKEEEIIEEEEEVKFPKLMYRWNMTSYYPSRMKQLFIRTMNQIMMISKTNLINENDDDDNVSVGDNDDENDKFRQRRQIFGILQNLKTELWNIDETTPFSPSRESRIRRERNQQRQQLQKQQEQEKSEEMKDEDEEEIEGEGEEEEKEKEKKISSDDDDDDLEIEKKLFQSTDEEEDDDENEENVQKREKLVDEDEEEEEEEEYSIITPEKKKKEDKKKRKKRKRVLFPGLIRSNRNVAIDLIKALFYFSIQRFPDLEDEILDIKKELLVSLQIDDDNFLMTLTSSKMSYNSPIKSYYIQNVLCTNCSECMDLNICKDDVLVRSTIWKCKHCDAPFDNVKEEIEERIIADVHIKIREFHFFSNEMKCEKCQTLIPKSVMQKHCEACAADWKPKMKMKQVEDMLILFLSIAGFYGFRKLEKIVNFYLADVF